MFLMVTAEHREELKQNYVMLSVVHSVVVDECTDASILKSNQTAL